MTLEEGIEGLEGEVREAIDEGALKAVAYLRLGIEALKRIQDARDIEPKSPVADLLPSETEEQDKAEG